MRRFGRKPRLRKFKIANHYSSLKRARRAYRRIHKSRRYKK